MNIRIASAAALLSLSMPLLSHANPITFDEKSTLNDFVGSELVTEDWSTFPVNTVLENQVIDGIRYETTSSEPLVVGGLHGASWRLGYARPNDKYASFSSQMISFEFENSIDAFGIALSQGNQNQGNRYVGFTTWLITIDGSDMFSVRADYDLGNFTGEAYFGLAGLGGARRVDVRRTYSDASIVWNLREISYADSRDVPEPGTLALLGFGVVGMGMRRRKVA